MAEPDANTEMITSAVLEVQAHTQVTFRGRQRNMAESQLDLFQASPALITPHHADALQGVACPALYLRQLVTARPRNLFILE